MATRNAQGERTRTRVLDAAMEVVEHRGGAALSLNSVAEQAGVSKGTLLYHYPTKEALVDAVVEHYLRYFEDAVADHARRHPGDHAWLRAYVAVGTDARERQRSRALFTVLAVDPDAPTRMAERLTAWQERAQAHPAPGPALLVKLAVDGLLLADVTNSAPPLADLLAAIDDVLACAGGSPPPG
jgi:AcrR family transcriptional regulator